MHFISKTEIEAIDDKLTTLWEEVVTIPGTHKYHFFETSGEENTKVAETSKSGEFIVVIVRENEESSGSKLLDLKKMKYLMKVSSHLQLVIGF